MYRSHATFVNTRRNRGFARVRDRPEKKSVMTPTFFPHFGKWVTIVTHISVSDLMQKVLRTPAYSLKITSEKKSEATIGFLAKFGVESKKNSSRSNK